MGLAWKQGRLASGALGTFLVPEPLPERLLYAEPLRRRMRGSFGGAWIADSEDVIALHEAGATAGAAWSYLDPYTEVARIGGLIAFEPDKVAVTIDGARLALAPGQTVVPHGPDRGLTPEEALNATAPPTAA